MKTIHMVDLSLLIVLSAALYTDFRARTISNRIILAGITAGLILNFFLSGPYGLLFSVKGFLIGIALLFLPFAAGGIGAGDVKLMGIIGSLKGIEFAFIAFLASALAGGILSLMVLVLKGRLWVTMRNLFRVLKFLFFPGLRANSLSLLIETSPGIRVPYAPAIAIGTILSYVYILYC